MTLFTKPDCKKCDWLKKEVDLEKLGVKVEVLTPDDSGALAHLAWHEQVERSHNTLPILVINDNISIEGVINIKNYLLETSDGKKGGCNVRSY